MPVATLLALIVCALLAAPQVEAKDKKRKRPSSTVSGVVLSMQDEPLAGVTVKLEPSDGSDPEPTATTDAKGEFSIKLHAGVYTLHLSRDGFTPFTGSVSIGDGQQRALRVQMLDSSMGRRNAAINAYNRAVEALESEDSAAAIRLLEESVEADPTLPEPLDLLAELQFDEGAFVESAATAERYLSLDPDNHKVQARAYAAYVQSGNQPKIDEWRNRLAQTGAVAMPEEIYNEGARAVHAGDMDTAVERFRQALELNPDLAEAHSGLATILYNREQLDEALAAADRALDLKPQDVSSLRVRFLIHEANGDRAEADAAIVAYAAVAPDDAVELLSTKADLDFDSGRRDEAATAWLNVLKIEPDLPEAHYKLGLIYSNDDTAKARTYLERFIALAPTAPEVKTAKDLLATF